MYGQKFCHKDHFALESLLILHQHNQTMDGLKQSLFSVGKASISCDRAVSWQWD